MALQNLVGSGIWIPTVCPLFTANSLQSLGDATLDADEEEFQIIGRVHIDGGGSKTFGTSGSKIGWLGGASITFVATATLRVGVKQASSISNSSGPPARATAGAAAFDVYKDLVGGTDTITSTTWRDDAMASGTPFTVSDGDMLAICFHLDVVANSQSVKVRQVNTLGQTSQLPCLTLVTSSGSSFAAQALFPNAILTFDDGTLGWIEPTSPQSSADTTSGGIGNSNIVGNIFQVPFPCKIDALMAIIVAGATANFDLVLYETPLGTPSLVEAISFDANQAVSASSGRSFTGVFTTPRTLAANTDYAIGIRQTTATSMEGIMYDVSTAAYFKAAGMGAECYGATSTAGATFAAANSGKRRYRVWARISALDDGAGSGGGRPEFRGSNL